MTFLLRISVTFKNIQSLKHIRRNLGSSVYFTAQFDAGAKERYGITASFKRYSSQQADSSQKLVPIYYGSLTNRVRNIKMVTLSTSFISILMQPFIYFKAIESGNPVPIFITFAMIATFSLCTPPLIHFVTKKYVTHVCYNSECDKYIATTYSLFIRKKQLEFTPNDVVVPAVTGMFTSIRIKGKPYFLDETMFQDIDHYKRIMGLDKPVDFQLQSHGSNIKATLSENKVQSKS